MRPSLTTKMYKLKLLGHEVYIVFGADRVGVCVTFFFVHFFLNQLMDFDQTSIDTLLGVGNEFNLIRFWRP